MRSAKIKEIEVPKIALGTWALGGGRDWGAQDRATAQGAISRALELGLNFIDTAPIYGNCNAETLLGKILKTRREKIILSTKCGLLPAPRAVKHCLRPQSVRREAEQSLKRLQTDYIDIYFIHRPDRATPLADTLGEFTRLKEEGKIRFIGVSNFPPQLFKQALALADISVIQNEYSFLNRSQGQSVFDICRKNGVAFMAYGPLAGGILSGKYKKEPNLPRCDARSFFYKFYKGLCFENSLKAVQKLQAVAQKHNATSAQAALNWVLADENVTCAAAGIRTPAQAEDIAAALNWELTPEDLKYLNESY